MSTPTNSFPAQTSFTKATDTFLMNVAGASSKVTGTNAITSLGVPTLGGTNSFTGANSFSLKSTNNTIYFVSGSYVFNTFAGATNSDFTDVHLGIDNNNGGFICTNQRGFVWFSGADLNGGARDTAFNRSAASVPEVNDGTPGAGHGGGINFPQRAGDADAPAPTSGATIYSKQVVGKNALFVRFPTGIPIQLSIEL